ncbi:flagellar basal body L-ring protein FlgH [Pseudorhodoferax sp. Leaf267]|uniref:flagellar basal body L-ring protein FlgH n=1 Tax=Pseudorhodoferax sp. Leaf267 TaxID=1736316 RepID=UPI0006FDCB8E|nr:flagellar basal body L-ring protein FlgH [Pseudorhodoferax sp. Leaf267]KQP13749.1 flagellar biosynthesis protein FlgH [Pseudorhodoferax sp. Leaf267]
MTHTSLRPWLLALAAFWLAGCETLQQTPKVEFPDPITTRPVAMAPQAPPVATGGLYSTVRYRPMFEDRRPRLVGDSLTVQVVENINASQRSSSTVDKSGSVSSGITGFPFLGSKLLGKLAVGAESENSFEGSGGTQSANTFSGTITVTVVDVLPNGHLQVAGDKQIGVNQNVDVLRFSGTVDPRAVLPGSVVPSTAVANVRVESRGRGQQQDAQVIGWLARFFLSVLPF